MEQRYELKIKPAGEGLILSIKNLDRPARHTVMYVRGWAWIGQRLQRYFDDRHHHHRRIL